MLKEKLKINNKINANTVGTDDSVCPHFEDPTLKTPKTHLNLISNRNGITLIALIITIIVMLILVGVTIGVALNGGLFDKAKTATKETEEEVIYEQIVGAMQTVNEGQINVKDTYLSAKDVLKNQVKGISLINPTNESEIGDSVTIQVEGKLGTYNYKITTKEIIKDDGQISPPQAKVYSFTLNDIKDAFKKRDTDGILYYDSTIFWNKIGANLSGQYGIDTNRGEVIGTMSTNSDILTCDFSSQPKNGCAALAFYDLRC